MPDESRRPDDVEKILHDEKSLESRKKALIEDLLKQREAAISAFDEKLEKLGYKSNSGRRRSHHKKSGAVPAAPVKTAEKQKA